jgi:chitin synthase
MIESPSTIVKANCSFAPNRRPSFKNANTKENPFSKIDMNHPVAQTLESFQNLLDSSSDVSSHVVFHEGFTAISDKKDEAPIRRDGFGVFGLETMKASESSIYCTSLVHSEFLYRYSEAHSRVPVFNTSQIECIKAIAELGWNDKMAIAGISRVFLSKEAWEFLSLRSKTEDPEDSELGDLSKTVLDVEAAEDEVSSEDDDDLALRPGLDVRDRAAIRKAPDLEQGKRKERQKIYEFINPAKKTSWKYPKDMSRVRKVWLSCTWCLTWWIPVPMISIFRRRTPETLMAFREKIALCILIFGTCLLLLFLVVALGPLICPNSKAIPLGDVAKRNKLNDPFVIVHGNVYGIRDIVQSHVYAGTASVSGSTFESTVLGQDVSPMFFSNFNTFCGGFTEPKNWDNYIDRYSSYNAKYIWFPHKDSNPEVPTYIQQINYMKKAAVSRNRNWIDNYLSDKGESHRVLIAWDRVYDVSSYYLATNTLVNSTGFMGPLVKQIFDQFSPTGKDATFSLNQLNAPAFGGPDFFKRVKFCMDGMFYIGVVDRSNEFRCQFSNYVLVITAGFIFAIVAVKFVASLQFGSPKAPEDQDKFIICMVSCFTEGYDSLSKTFTSLAMADYDGQRKLLFVVCDGMVIGHGNDRPTPRIVLDILGVKADVDPEPVAYEAVGKESKQFNFAKVYSGLYKVDGNEMPFIVVTKIGKPSERQQPGNR